MKRTIYTNYPNELYIRFPRYSFTGPNSALNILSNRCFALSLSSDEGLDTYHSEIISSRFELLQAPFSVNPVDRSNVVLYDYDAQEAIAAFEHTIGNSATGTYDYTVGAGIGVSFTGYSVSASDMKCRPFFFNDLQARRIFTYNATRHNNTTIDNKLYTVLAPQTYKPLYEPDYFTDPYKPLTESVRYSPDLRFSPGTGSVIQLPENFVYEITSRCDLKQSYKLSYTGLPGTTATFTVLTSSFTVGNIDGNFIFDLNGPQQYTFAEIPSKKSFRFETTSPGASSYNTITVNYVGSAIDVNLPKWAIVDNAQTYPDFDLMYGKYLSGFFPPVDVNSRNGFSKPFSMSLLLRYYNYRYWLEHPPSEARPCQPSVSGRWVTSKENAFTVYVPYICAYDYDFGFRITNTTYSTSPIYSASINKNIFTFGVNDFDPITFIVSNQYVKIMYLQNVSFLPSEVDTSFQNDAVNYSFYPFDNNRNAVVLPYDSEFAQAVATSDINAYAAAPALDAVFVWQINSGVFSPNDQILSGSFDMSPGVPVNLKTAESKSNRFVAFSNKDNNSFLSIFQNNTTQVSCVSTEIVTISPGVTAVSCVDQKTIGELYNKEYLNIFNDFSITNTSQGPNEQWAYDFDFIPVQQNINKNLLFVSSPGLTGWSDGRLQAYFWNDGELNVQPSWKEHGNYIYGGGNFDFADNGGYGKFVRTSGRYLLVGSVSGVDFVNSLPENPLDTLHLYRINSVDYAYDQMPNDISLDCVLTDELFITGGHIVDIDICANYDIVSRSNRKTQNFYGDHVIVTLDNGKTLNYSINFNKLEPLNTIEFFNYDSVKMYNNAFIGVNNNNSNIFVHVINQFNI